MKKGLAVVLSLMMVLGILPFNAVQNNIAEAAETWEVVDITAVSASDVVLIVANYEDTKYLLYNANGTGSAPTAVVWDGSSEVADTCKWNISSSGSSYTFYPNGDTTKWLYCTGTNNGVRVGTNTNKTFTLDASGYFKHEGTGRYLGVYRTNPDWRCYTSTTTNIGGQTFSIYRLASSSSTETATPAPEVTATPAPEATATPTPEVSTDDYSGTYYIATKRTSGNYFYMTNDLGTASTKRYQAVDSGLTELPAVIENAESNKTFTLSKNADGTYTITDSNGLYLAHKNDNSGILQEGPFNVTVALSDGTFNIHYTMTDGTVRYLSLNSNSSYNYFAWYTGTQKQDLSLIPVTGTASTPTPTPVVTPTPTSVVTATPTPSGDGRSFQLVTDLSGITDGSYVIVAVNEYGKATVTNVFGALTRQLVESSWVVSTSADSFMGSDASSIPTNITVNNDLLVWALEGDSSGVTLTAEDASGVLRNSSNNLYYDSGTASTYTIQVSKTGLQNAFNIVNDTRILAWRLTLSGSVSYDRYRFAASSNNPTGGYCSNLYFYKEVEAGSCAVTFKDADGSILNTMTVANGGSLSLIPSPTAPTNFSFVGWTDEATGTVYTVSQVLSMAFTSNMTFVATYERTHVTVSFGATSGGTLSSTASLSLPIGSALTSAQLPAPTANEHYTFTGWTVNGASVTPTSYTLTDDTNFIANFVIDSYSVVFNDINGGQLSAQTVNYGSYMTVPTPPTVVGYTFLGWSDGSKVYTSNELRYLIIEEDQVYTAVYQATTYQVGFAASEGGSISAANSFTVQYGNTISSAGISFPTATPNNGYSFAGWLINGTLYSSAAAAGAVEIKADMTIVAQFYANEITVTFCNSDGTTILTNTIASGGTVTAPTEPTLAGHTFAGWSDGVNVYTSAQINAMSFTETTTYTAVMTPIQYTVTFVSDGTTVATQTINYGSSAALPIQPSVEGLTFIGWAVDGTIVDVNTYIITQDTTFIAQYSDILVEPYVTVEGSLGMPDSVGYRVDSDEYYYMTDTLQTGKEYIIAVQYNGTWYAVSNDPYNSGDLTGGLKPVQMTLDGEIISIADASKTEADIKWNSRTVVDSNGDDIGYCCLVSDASEYLSYRNPNSGDYKWLTYNTSLTYAEFWQYDSDTKRLNNHNYESENYGIYWDTAQGTIDVHNSSLLDVYLFEKIEPEYYEVSIQDGASNTISQIYVYVTEITESGTYQVSAKLSSDYESDTVCYWYSSNPEVATVDQNGLITYTGVAGTTVIAVLAPFTVDGHTYYARDFFMFSISNDDTIYPLEDTDDLENFPEFPDQGSVRIDKKVVDTTIYDSTGVAEVELSVAGIPYTKLLDVVLVVDLSNTMNATDDDSTTRLDEAKTAAKEFVETLLRDDDGNYNDHRVSLVTFATGGSIVFDLTGATSDEELDAIFDAIDGMAVAGATNYDAGLAAANMVLTSAKTAEPDYDREQYVIFMTDGAPNCYNLVSVASSNQTGDFAFSMPSGAVSSDLSLYYLMSRIGSDFNRYAMPGNTSWTSVSSNATYYVPFLEAFWPLWTTGSVALGSTISLGYRESSYVSTTELTASDLPGLMNRHHAGNLYASLTKGDIEYDPSLFGTAVSKLDATIYTIGYGLSNGSNVVSFSYTAVDFTGAQCEAVLNLIASSEDKALNAANVEELSAVYQLIAESILLAASDATVTDVMGPEFDLQVAASVPNEDGGRDEIGITPSVEVGYWVLDEVTRERVYFTSMEKFTFTTDANGNVTAVTSDIVGSCYNTTEHTFEGQYLSYDFDTETFEYKFDIDGELEMTLKYWVYLTGSMEGTRSAGVYDTNDYAKLRYTNYVGWNCQLTFPVPKLPWGAAIVQYSYYLVDEEGNPINTNGTVVPFAERIIVGDTYTHEFALNSTQNIYAIANIPTGYVPYNTAASYQVMATNGGTLGSAVISDSTGTTYLIAPVTSNQTGASIDVGNYSYTHVLFAVVSTDSKDLAFTALGAQAHMIHKNRYLNTAALYTDGMRFGIEVKTNDLQKSLNPGEYFAFGLMMQPSYRLAGLTSATAFDLNTQIDNISRFTPTIDASGNLYVGNGSVVFNSRSNDILATRTIVNGRSHYTIDPTTMIRWTEEMENATSAEDLVSLLREAGCTIFSLNEDGSGFRYVTKLMYSSDEEVRAEQANTEITYGGLFVKLNSDGEYVLNTTLQKTNSAQRIFVHYNFVGYQVGSEASLNGWSLYGPSLEVQAGWN